MRAFLRVFVLVAASHLVGADAYADLVIETVPVGNAGNAGDVQEDGTFGAVGYDYRIGIYEVTNDQYATFLNAVALSDPVGFYNTNMGTSVYGGITRSGSSGSYSYVTKPDMDDKPVNFVSWYDAARFANWLHNGQPIGLQGVGTTETGAYTLEGLSAIPLNGLSITRNSGALWFLPTEDEWYKAAYHKNDGATGNYFEYPTSSDSTPTLAEADANGNISNPGENVANYDRGADWNSQNGNVTTVGSAGLESASPYFTFDQGGNVHEWNETLVEASNRGIRGGYFLSSSATPLEASGPRASVLPTLEGNHVGFRIATTAVPEASPMLLGSLACVAVAVVECIRRFRSRSAKRASVAV